MSGIIKQFANKCLSLFRFGADWLNKLASKLVEAAKSQSYIETTSSTQADTLHKEIKYSDGKIFKKEFEKVVRWAIPKLNLKNKKVKIAIDVTEDLTWSEQGGGNTRPSSKEHQLKSWQFLTISVVDPYFFPLMSVPYRQVDDLDSLIIGLLKYVKTLPLTVDLVIFDRGFYHAYLIDFLENLREKQPWPYLIFTRRTEAIKNYIQETEIFETFDHEFYYKRDKSSWKTSTKIIVWKPDPKVHPNVAWPFATNQSPSVKLLDEYPKRWNIETNFRVHDEGHIKSKSAHPLIRFFYHILGMVFVILWRIQSVQAQHIVFKRFLGFIESKYESFIVHKDPPPSVIVY